MCVVELIAVRKWLQDVNWKNPCFFRVSLISTWIIFKRSINHWFITGLWRRAVIILLIGLWVKTVNAVTLVKEEPVSSTEFTATTPYNSSNTPADVDDLAITVNTTVPYLFSSTTIAPHSCVHGVMKIPPEEGISLHNVQGRYVVTIITSDPYSPQLVLERAKAFNQLEQNFDIGNLIDWFQLFQMVIKRDFLQNDPYFQVPVFCI